MGTAVQVADAAVRLAAPEEGTRPKACKAGAGLPRHALGTLADGRVGAQVGHV